MVVEYEAFFGLHERPFSLTPDPKYFFKGRSHARAFEALMFALNRRDPVMLVLGDLGVGKTTLCCTIAEHFQRRASVIYLPNPFFSDADLAALATDSIVIIDEAQLACADLASRLAPIHVPILLASQTGNGGALPSGLLAFDGEITTRVRVAPFGRQECEAYISHRVAVAGRHKPVFTSRAVDVVFRLSGGMPRLINLLCERALQTAGAAASEEVDAADVDAAASALELLRARHKRFRWFHTRVS